jgi:hypothetical protein
VEGGGQREREREEEYRSGRCFSFSGFFLFFCDGYKIFKGEKKPRSGTWKKIK